MKKQGDGTFDPTFVAIWDLYQGMHTPVQCHDAQPFHQHRMSTPSKKGELQPPPMLPRPPRHRPHRQQTTHPVHPSVLGSQYEEEPCTTRQRLR